MSARRARTWLADRLRSVPAAAWALLAAAFAARVALIAATGDFRPVADPADYERYAVSLANHGSFPGAQGPVPGPTAYRPPAYPLLLGALFEVGGSSRTFARLAQAALGTVTVGLIGVLANRLWGRRTALIALAIAAFYLPLAALGTTFLSEVLLVPLMLGAVLLALRAHAGDERRRVVIAAGVLVGLAVLTRPNAVLLLVPLAVAVGASGGRRFRWRPAIALVAVAAATVVPWTIRNAIQMDAFVPVSTQDGPTLAGTYNDTARTRTDMPAQWVEWFRDPRYAVYGTPERALPEAELNARLRSDALEYAREHPGYVLEVAYWNFARLLHLTGLDDARFDARGTSLPGWLGAAGAVQFWLLAPLAVAGAFTVRARRAPRWLWLVPAAMLVTIFIVSYTRFRAPADPFVILLAALGAGAIAARVRGPR